MDFTFQNSVKLKEFMKKNGQNFEEKLLLEAVSVRDKINEILTVGNVDLVTNAHTLVGYVIEGREEEVKVFAKQEGIVWATHAMELTFKLEWIQAIRRTLWKFIQEYNSSVHKHTIEDFFELEQQINNQIDSFLNSFFISYSTYKDSLIRSHRQMVETLSVPIIPLDSSVSILPLIGSMDSFRTMVMEEKVLTEVGVSRIQILIMDLSGIADIENEVIDHLLKIIEGISMMGCKTVITGLRTEVVRKMIHAGLSFEKRTETLGTLQQALRTYLIK